MNRLTLPAVKNAKPRASVYKLADGFGLSLLVEPAGAKLWRFRYRFAGKESMISLGAWPEVSIAEARALRDEARAKLRQGVNPSSARREARIAAVARSGNTFAAVAADWIEANRNQWKPSHVERVQSSLDRDILPALGKRPIAEITAGEALAVLKRVEERDALEQATRVLQRMTSVFALGVATLRCPVNPARELRGALKKAPKVQHHPSLKLEAFPDFLKRLQAVGADSAVKAALKLIPLTTVRVSELIGARWSEFAFGKKSETSLWTIPGERMKMGREHLVPLSTQAVAALEQLKAESSGTELLFPGRSDRNSPMSGNALLMALRRMGYKSGQITVHGFRSTFSTWAHESNYDSRVIEMTLAHVDKNAIRDAYNRAQYLDQRRTLLQDWANAIDAQCEGAKVIPIKRKKA